MSNESDGSGDSLDAIELVMEMEEKFDITISDDDAQKIRTVADAFRYIEEGRGGSSTSGQSHDPSR